MKFLKSNKLYETTKAEFSETLDNLAKNHSGYRELLEQYRVIETKLREAKRICANSADERAENVKVLKELQTNFLNARSDLREAEKTLSNMDEVKQQMQALEALESERRREATDNEVKRKDLKRKLQEQVNEAEETLRKLRKVQSQQEQLRSEHEQLVKDTEPYRNAASKMILTAN